MFVLPSFVCCPPEYISAFQHNYLKTWNVLFLIITGVCNQSFLRKALNRCSDGMQRNVMQEKNFKRPITAPSPHPRAKKRNYKRNPPKREKHCIITFINYSESVQFTHTHTPYTLYSHTNTLIIRKQHNEPWCVYVIHTFMLFIL